MINKHSVSICMLSDDAMWWRPPLRPNVFPEDTCNDYQGAGELVAAGGGPGV